MRVLLKTKGELLRDLLDALLSGAASSWTEGALPECLLFLDQDLPLSFSEAVSLEGKSERAPIMDLTDILLFLRGEVGEAGVVDSGGVGVFGGVGRSCGFCCNGVSVHIEDLRDREKKDFESELRVLPLLPGLRAWLAHESLFDRGGVSVCSGRTMEGEAEEVRPASRVLLIYLIASLIPDTVSNTGLTLNVEHSPRLLVRRVQSSFGIFHCSWRCFLPPSLTANRLPSLGTGFLGSSRVTPPFTASTGTVPTAALPQTLALLLG